MLLLSHLTSPRSTSSCRGMQRRTERQAVWAHGDMAAQQCVPSAVGGMWAATDSPVDKRWPVALWWSADRLSQPASLSPVTSLALTLRTCGRPCKRSILIQCIVLGNPSPVVDALGVRFGGQAGRLRWGGGGGVGWIERRNDDACLCQYFAKPLGHSSKAVGCGLHRSPGLRIPHSACIKQPLHPSCPSPSSFSPRILTPDILTSSPLTFNAGRNPIGE